MKQKHLRLMLKIAYFSLLIIFSLTNLTAATTESEKIFNELSKLSKGTGNIDLVNNLNTISKTFDWSNAKSIDFQGNLRLIKSSKPLGVFEKDNIYLIRNTNGKIYILSLPDKFETIKENSQNMYSGLNNMLQSKAIFSIKVYDETVKGKKYTFGKLVSKPYQSIVDKIFKISIVAMLFLVMVGMGMTLTLKDFKLIAQQPKGVIFGTVLQFGLMPFIAFTIGHLMNFYTLYPFIFVGMVLVAATPGGATSNLMTYFAKGDLALSISLTSFSTILSIFFTPLILTLYCTNVPNVNMPVKLIMVTILVLVLIPLIIGMTVNFKFSRFAQKAKTFFSILGLVAVLFIIIAGVLSNLHIFADTERHGIRFYSMIFLMTFIGMLSGALLTKLIGVSNYQTRAVSMEIGIRNVSLSMVIALLIQDFMGDFHSSMFATSGIFGLFMYIAGIISIQLYKKFLPAPSDELQKSEIPINENYELN